LFQTEDPTEIVSDTKKAGVSHNKHHHHKKRHHHSKKKKQTEPLPMILGEKSMLDSLMLVEEERSDSRQMRDQIEIGGRDSYSKIGNSYRMSSPMENFT
jgi:hypothetical protein